MKKAARIFWRIFIGGFLALIILVGMANFGVFGKMPSLTELEIHPSSRLPKCLQLTEH